MMTSHTKWSDIPACRALSITAGSIFSPGQITKTLHKQRGAAAIEAALMFVLFFSLFYAIVSYALPLLMVQAFNHAAASGARSALAIEPDEFENTSQFIEQGVKPRVREVIAETLDWLPPTAKTAVLGTQNNNIVIEFNETTGVLAVTVIYSGYREAPLIPTLKLPGMGDVPRLPTNLQGSASVSL
ncbi:TadE/TadG family type IV pilus assembly protein [Methylophaga pinxianii]|uniref:TadE/TadG family type IV pilus assembly protein n=1 Tax=Methylophaga pinxianii TaxID=2881052 RepID=UPI001CF16ECE|nr:TadE/TadG family type IV pilus assembly protein [Methylophaga pinxianii]MCB2428252.1 pilus assembly protein [Methylophaga pinxianii]UPH45863.1 pilus assembly protein [Methylophaga pinxianii]